MRTHRLIFNCNCPEFAEYFDKEILQLDFCDLTHWYCGLDKAGDDTPDCCIIYKGIIHPERIYVELDIKKSGGMTVDDLERLYVHRYDGATYFTNEDFSEGWFSNFKIKYPSCDTWRFDSVLLEELS